MRTDQAQESMQHCLPVATAHPQMPIELTMHTAVIHDATVRAGVQNVVHSPEMPTLMIHADRYILSSLLLSLLAQHLMHGLLIQKPHEHQQ